MQFIIMHKLTDRDPGQPLCHEGEAIKFEDREIADRRAEELNRSPAQAGFFYVSGWGNVLQSHLP